MDVAHLKKHGHKESYIFYVDSQFRDKNMYQTPSEYSITFDSPFKNVYALEILDASIPRTQYSIDTHNNTLVVFYGYGNSEYTINLEPGDYNDLQIIEEINLQFNKQSISIEIGNVSDPGDKKNTFRFISRTEFTLNMEKSTMRTELGFNEYVKAADFNILYDAEYSDNNTIVNKQYFKAIQTIEIDPLKYDTFNAFNQKAVDSDNFVSSAGGFILNAKESNEFADQPDNALYQKFNISSETDGVYGYLSKIQIHIGDNTGKIKFSIAVVSRYKSDDGIYIYKKLKLGNTETIELESHQRIGTWIAPIDFTPDSNVNNMDILTPGEYYLFVYGVVHNEGPNLGGACSLSLETLSNVTNEQSYTILDNISFNIDNQVSEILDNDDDITYEVETKVKSVANEYYKVEEKCFHITGGGYLISNEAPDLLLHRGKSYTFENTSVGGYQLLFYYYSATNVIHVDNYEHNKTDSNKLGRDRVLDLTYGISVIYNVNSTTITLNKTRANTDDITLYYASPIHSYAGNKIQVIDSTSTIEKPNPPKSIAFTIETKENPYTVTAPGIFSLVGDRYTILRCPEIEQHLYRSRAFERYTMGLGKFKLSALGYDNETSMDFTKLPMREFHPIGKLTHMSFRFERPDGQLYNFKGINHTLTFAIKYYEPADDKEFTNYQLNPDYNPNFMEYIQNQESSDESESESD